MIQRPQYNPRIVMGGGMKKDWVIWGGCVLLFGAGVIWGLMWTKKEFFYVQSIHDLAEIASSIATVAAVFIALTAWKKQLRAQADHDLARRVVVGAERFKKAALNLIIDSQFCCENASIQFADYNLIARIEAGIASRLAIFDEEIAAFEALLVEVRAIWGSELDTLFERVRGVASQSYESNKNFLMFLAESGNPDIPDGLEVEVHVFCDQLPELGLNGGPAEVSRVIADLASSADAYLKRRLRV